jgi:hypothetical protein
VKERELQNLLRWLPGYEASQVNYKGEKAMGFALFSCAQHAIAAKDALQVNSLKILFDFLIFYCFCCLSFFFSFWIFRTWFLMRILSLCCTQRWLRRISLLKEVRFWYSLSWYFLFCLFRGHRIWNLKSFKEVFNSWKALVSWYFWVLDWT